MLTADWSRRALADRQVLWSPHWASLAWLSHCSHRPAAQSSGRRRANCWGLRRGWGSPGSRGRGVVGNLRGQVRYNWAHCNWAEVRGKIFRDLRTLGDLLELPSSWVARRAGLEEEGDLLYQGDHWDHSNPELAGTGPVMEDSLDTGLQVLQAGGRDLHKVHKVRGHHSLVSVPGSRGTRGRKEELPGPEVQEEVGRVLCTCVAGDPC